MDSGRIFLTAEWRDLVMLNYEVDPELLSPYLPRGTEIDYWNAKAFVSLVAFRFLNTKVLGIRVPFHSSFTEVNLRFYVRRRQMDEVRRGVVFISEIVPRRAIALVARIFYNENYVALPMAHKISGNEDGGISASYRWRSGIRWNEMSFESQGGPEPSKEGSEERFITEHYWGYAAQRDGGCVEYQVVHPSWKVWQARAAEFIGDAEPLYGPAFAAAIGKPPSSAFLADGSPVTVMRGRRL